MAGMEPHIEYATASDGRRIACFAIGAGKPLLISATPPWSHVQQEMRIPAVGAWLRELAEQARVIRYDCRGTGLSDRDAPDFSVGAQVRDMEAVADHYGLDSCAIWGTIGGSPASIAYAARHPERVSHLLLWGAFVRGASLFKKVPGFSVMGDLIRDNWQVYTDMFAQVAFGWPDSDTAAGYAQLMRDAITQEAMLQAVRQTVAIDVTDESRAVRVPTLVLVRRGATISGVEDARELAGLIPSARLLILDGSSHAPFLENPALVTEAIRAFIASEQAPRAPRRAAVPLTEREHQVLRLLANGRTGKEIAGELAVSVPTAQRHIANIYAKIGARGRVEAAAYAFEHGMLPRRQT
jgi:pimeloyl-ACP methyl ester carboxylesterase/DNA-binding CsgD family transcriptional regulator